VSAVKKALTIAGSDPSGGAGIQADIKTFSQLHVYGMAVVAALTAQNTLGISAVAEVAAEFVGHELDAVLTDLPPDATKTGMLLTAAVIDTVAQKVKQHRIVNLVVDPVMVATSGKPLLNPDAIGTLRRALIPLAFLITPNMEEAATLTGQSLRTPEDMEQAALRIHAMGARYVLVKGGHMPGDDLVDVLFDGNAFLRFQSTRIASPDTHGTGCVLSAAITAYLAIGAAMPEAVQSAKEFVTAAIRNGLRIGGGRGPCDPLSLGN
jgi:hydroxymethylpyrimidine/phosphomethylpyrimidine kinase